MNAPLRHRIGDKIQDRYEVQRLLGAGAYGTVYLCRDAELGVQVAVKELHVLDEAGGAERQAALRQFRLEATHLSRLRHPHIVSGHYQPHSGQWNICPLCGFAYEQGYCPQHNAPIIPLTQRHYLVMEYVDGLTLGEAAQQAGGALPVERALRLVRQIAGALALIHENGWIHRDVKPENIRLRTRGDQAVLLDFGIAGESGAQEGYSTRVQRHTQGGGTPGYAPESLNERNLPDARSDIHALGMTLYSILSGRDATEPEDLLLMRKHRPSFFNRAIPPTLDGLILRAIHLDPARRPADGSAFLAALDELIVPQPAAPGTAPTAPPPVAAEGTLRFRNGTNPGDLGAFVHLADQFPREAQEMLVSGTLANWLERIGHFDLASRARRLRVEYARHPARALEGFLQATEMVDAPRLRVEPAHVDFGTLEPGQRSTVRMQISNPGRGHLFGFVRATHPQLELSSEFDGAMQIPVSFHAPEGRGWPLGKQQGEIVVDSSAGELRVPFSARVRFKQTPAPFLTVLGWSLFGMAAGQFLRTWPTQSQGAGWGWLSWQEGLRWLPAAPLFAVAFWLMLLVFAGAEAQRHRSCGFMLWGGALAALGGMASAVSGNYILVAGDEFLRPLFSPLARDFAAGGWMFLGCILGAAYGTFRRWKDVFSPRILHICVGWLSGLLIAYGVLAAALEAH